VDNEVPLEQVLDDRATELAVRMAALNAAATALGANVQRANADMTSISRDVTYLANKLEGWIRSDGLPNRMPLELEHV